MGTWVEDIAVALHELGGIAPLSEIYNRVRETRPEPHPASFDAVIRGAIEQHSSDSAAFMGGQDIFFSVEGLGAGIWGLRDAMFVTPEAVDLPSDDTVRETARVEQTAYRSLRDTRLARELKALHRNRCQVCYELIELPNGEGYSEAHHIRPLGNPHNGPDVAGNIVVLCPNHHAMLDYGCIRLSINDLRVQKGHVLDQSYIDYHNEVVFGRRPG